MKYTDNLKLDLVEGTDNANLSVLAQRWQYLQQPTRRCGAPRVPTRL